MIGRDTIEDLRGEREYMMRWRPVQDRAAFKVILGNGKKTRDEPNKANGATLQQNAFRYLLDRQYNDVVDLIASFLYAINLFLIFKKNQRYQPIPA